MADNQDVEILISWLFEANPEQRKLLRILVKNTMIKVMEFYMVVVPNKSEEDDPNGDAIKGILARCASELDNLEMNWGESQN